MTVAHKREADVTRFRECDGRDDRRARHLGRPDRIGESSS
jgi:hypothetical protein